MAVVRIVTYNIHGAVGCDGRFAPERIRDVLRETRADIVALQEVMSGAGGRDLLAWFEAETGFHAVAGPTLRRPDGVYGNALLARGAIHAVELVDLSVRGREPRGAIAADVDCAGARLRVIATHLGLGPAERRSQVQKLIHLCDADFPTPAVVAGDLNEWFLWGRPLRWLHAHFEETPAAATFPSRWPVFALDRMWARPRSILRQVSVHRSPLARVASDHLPVVGLLDLPVPGTGPG